MKKLFYFLALSIYFSMGVTAQTYHYQYVNTVKESTGVKFIHDRAQITMNSQYVTFYNDMKTMAFTDENGIMNRSQVYFKYYGDVDGLHIYKGAYSSAYGNNVSGNIFSVFYLMAQWGMLYHMVDNCNVDIYFSDDYSRINFKLYAEGFTHVGKRVSKETQAPSQLY